MERTIGVTDKTKQLFLKLATGYHHDFFVRRLLHLWMATPAEEIERKLERFERDERLIADALRFGFKQGDAEMPYDGQADNEDTDDFTDGQNTQDDVAYGGCP